MNFVRQHVLGHIKAIHLVGLVILAGLYGLRHWDPAPLETLRLRVFDFYQNIEPRERKPTPVPVVIIDLDEDSLARYGQWPWPRTLLAKLVDQLMAYQVAVVGFDVFFSEYDRLSPTLIADQLAALDPDVVAQVRNLPASELVFAESMRKGRVVLGQGTLEAKPETQRDSRAVKASFAELGGDPRPRLTSFPAVLRNVKELEDAALGLGLVTLEPEVDGVVRRVNLAFRIDDEIYPALAIEMLRIASQQKSIVLKTDAKSNQQSVIVRPFKIPTDPKFRAWIHFRPRDETMYISAADVLDGVVAPERLQNALALIGTSALGLKDIRTTPIDKYLPGVDVHAQLLEMILTGSFLERPGLVQNMELTAVVVLGFLTIILVPLLGATYTLLFAVVSMSAMAGTSWYFYVEKQILVDAVYPSIAGLLMYMSLTYMNYIREEAQKKQVRDAFSMYMSPALVEQLAEDPTQLTLGGEMRDMTLLFCDIRGFTTISEQFNPEELTSFINRFLTPMTDVILDRQGTIDKYMGDCIMAFWNAPLDDDDHARHGCASALAMLEACAKLNEEVKAEAAANNRKYIPVRVGLGLNSDTVCVGNMGSEQRFDYSVLGDGVNLAARLEGQSKTYGVDVVIGEGTKVAAPEFAIIELDLIQVKGKTKPARIFGLLGGTDMAQSDDFIRFAERHATMLEDYRAQRWDEAAVGAAECRNLCQPYNAEGLYGLFDERIAAHRADPPGADWEGVFIATSK